MAYITGFSDNQLIGVDDLNAITKRLVTGGVGGNLTDSGSVEVTSLNGYAAALATDGVVPESTTSLKVTKNGSTITVAPGVAFFADGSFIEITTKETLNFSESDGYVYLINDIALGERKPRVSPDYPTGDYVLLAQISSDVLKDTRKYAKGKLPSYSSYVGYPLYVKKQVVCTGSSRLNRKGSFTLDISGYPLNGIVIKGNPEDSYSATGICFFDENRNVSFYICKPNCYDRLYSNWLYQHCHNSSRYAYMTFSCSQDGILTVNVSSSSNVSSATETETETIEFIIF